MTKMLELELDAGAVLADAPCSAVNRPWHLMADQAYRVGNVRLYRHRETWDGIWPLIRSRPSAAWATIGYHLYQFWKNYAEPIRRGLGISKWNQNDRLYRLAMWCGDRAAKYGALPLDTTWPRYDVAAPGTHGSLRKPQNATDEEQPEKGPSHGK